MLKIIINKILSFRLVILLLLLVLGIIVRLYGIDNPVADWHSFRQVDTISVSYLYAKNGINLFVPKYHDISTIQSGKFNPEGYRFVEFPVYNALITLMFSAYGSIGIEVWGRLVSIFFSCLSAVLLYLIGKRYLGSIGGLLSAFFYLFIPFNIYFTRVILPEPLATTTALLGIYLFDDFVRFNKKIFLFSSAICFSLALLIKPFTIFYMMPVVYLAFKLSNPKSIKAYLNMAKKYFFFGLIIVLPFAVWRVWEGKHPEGIPFYNWLFNGDGIRFKPSFWRWIFGERLGYLILGTWGLIPFGYGLIKKTKNYFIHFFILGMFLYVSTAATANVRHDYYQTFIIPAVSLILASGALVMLKKNLTSRIVLIFSIFVMTMVGLINVKEFYKIDHPEIINAGVAVDNLLPKNSLIIAPYNGDTAFLYQTKHIGWPYVDRPIDEMISEGAKYYVSTNYDAQTQEFANRFPIVKKTDEYIILKLE